MTITIDGARERTTAPAPPRRDAAVDATRVALLIAVFVLHATMAGVSVGPGGPVLQNALEGQAWFAPVSWIAQIMPLFFIVGGFSSIGHWRRMRAGGARGADYVRGRIERLVRPALVLVGAVTAGLFALSAAGLPAEMVETAGYRIGQPLWFLGVYLACSALVPVMVRAHESAPVLTPATLLAGVVAVDVFRLASGVDAIGFLNLLLVWLLVQQAGFWLADGRFDRLGRLHLLGLAVGALALLAALTVLGPYPADMLVNLNPPTVCLVVLGVAQLALFVVARERIGAWAEKPPVARVVAAIGARAMTAYLWHMPVLVAAAGLCLAANAFFGLPLPEPLSAEWWATRGLWLAVTGAMVVPVARILGRFETRRRSPGPVASARGTGLDATLGVAAVAVLLVAGFGAATGLLALALLGTALVGSTRLLTFGRALLDGARLRPASGVADDRRVILSAIVVAPGRKTA